MEIDIRLTLDDLNICLTALGKLPLEASLGTWSRLKVAGEKAVEASKPRPVTTENEAPA